ncbi:hypothetical protein ACGFIE_30405 [Micromonospora sp. NPDC049275]|uniref:hypothetical protein n=1 Tax=Micromonospora sp. NPDC049275 TaxID=3364268 RepID=UPI003715B624
MLEGLDEVSWNELSHAYGEALDTPNLLRQAASPDEEAAQEAVSELNGSIFHQGTVYLATVAAVPFLAELALAAPHGRADLAWMLGQLADPQHAYGDDFPDVRAAVVGQLPALLALLEDGDQEVREAAAYAAAQAGTIPEPLWQTWWAETSEPVQASLALALGLIDPAAAEPVLADLVLRAAPLVRVAAAVALLRAGLPWPDGAIAAVVAAIDDGASVTYCWVHGGDWSDELMVAPPAPVAVDLLNRLLRARKPKTRELGLWAASARCDASRSAPPQIAPMVATALHDPDPGVRNRALDTLSRAGKAAGRFADLLASVAAGFAREAGAPGFTAEYRAVGALARLGDPRWIEPVCAAAAAGHPAQRLLDGARFEPAVLAAVRQRLADEPARADVLAGVLGTWRATEAVPELLAALPYEGPQVAWALLEIGHDDVAAVPHLLARATQADDQAAALAIRRISGDVQPLLDILDAALSGERRLRPGPQTFVDELGDELRPVLPAARGQLTGAAARTHPQREAQILAARMVAAIDGVQPVLTTVRAVLAGGHTPARAAAELVADLAPAHRDALTDLDLLLRNRLGDRWSRVAASRALVRLGVPSVDLTEPLVHGVTDYAGRYGLATILELQAVETIPGLEELAARDNRLGATSFADDIVWADELLTDRICATIAALRRLVTNPHGSVHDVA